MTGPGKVRAGDLIDVNGQRYRIRQITETSLFFLSKGRARLARYKIAWPRGLRLDARAGAWRTPDGTDVKLIDPKGAK